MRVIMVKDVAVCNIDSFFYDVMFLWEGVLQQQACDA